ncbi:Sulfotransferase 6B1 [Bagarius yarrelli]|nr:Sulfotransferase 6B1 [Bagarius yarrelli]
MSDQAFATEIKKRLDQGMSMKDEEKLYRKNGILYPKIVSPPENLDALKDMEAREDDVMLVAYPKCGSNWMVGVLRKIMEPCGHTLPQGPPLIEFHSPEKQKVVAQMPPRRLLATHLHPKDIPVSFIKTKMLVLFRNPKDTLVSYYHFMNNNPVMPSAESWDKFFSDFMSGDVPWGSYFDHALSWDKRMDDPNVLVITYEELKENLLEGIKKVIDFFNFTLTDEQIKLIAEGSTFSAMLASSKATHGNFRNIVFRKGEIGDWRNHFSEAQSKQMDEEFQKKLAGTKLGAKLKYEQYSMKIAKGSVSTSHFFFMVLCSVLCCRKLSALPAINTYSAIRSGSLGSDADGMWQSDPSQDLEVYKLLPPRHADGLLTSGYSKLLGQLSAKEYLESLLAKRWHDGVIRSDELSADDLRMKRHSDAVFTDNYSRFRKQMAAKKYLNSVLAGKRSPEDALTLSNQSKSTDSSLPPSYEDEFDQLFQQFPLV